MKPLLILFSFLAVTFGTSATDGYVILRMTSDKITYKGVPCHINDTIYNLQALQPGCENDAMKLRDLNNNQMVMWSAKKQKLNSLDSNGLVVSGHLSSRDLFDLPQLIAELNDVVLFDDWHCYTIYPTNDFRWFEISFETPAGPVTKKLEGTPDGEIIINRNLFNGVDTPTVNATVKCVFADGEEILVSDRVVITLADSVD